MKDTYMLTTQETRVIHDLAKVWGWFLALPDITTDDARNFRDAIHVAQRIIIGRPGRRQLEKLDPLLASLLARTGKTCNRQPEKS